MVYVGCHLVAPRQCLTPCHSKGNGSTSHAPWLALSPLSSSCLSHSPQCPSPQSRKPQCLHQNHRCLPPDHRQSHRAPIKAPEKSGKTPTAARLVHPRDHRPARPHHHQKTVWKKLPPAAQGRRGTVDDHGHRPIRR
jgi:hypothetical protein